MGHLFVPARAYELGDSFLMLGAFDYYRGKNIKAYQIVLMKPNWTIDVPNLSQPPGPNQAPGWRCLTEEWTYPVPRDSVALTDLNVLRGGWITEVMRWEEDQWEIFSGGRLRYQNQKGESSRLVFCCQQTTPFCQPLIFVLKPGSGATKKNQNGTLGVKLRSRCPPVSFVGWPGDPFIRVRCE